MRNNLVSIFSLLVNNFTFKCLTIISQKLKKNYQTFFYSLKTHRSVLSPAVELPHIICFAPAPSNSVIPHKKFPNFFFHLSSSLSHHSPNLSILKISSSV